MAAPIVSIEQIIARIERLSRGAKREESTISRWVFGGGAKVTQLRQGRDVCVATLSKAALRLDELEAKFLLQPSGEGRDSGPVATSKQGEKLMAIFEEPGMHLDEGLLGSLQMIARERADRYGWLGQPRGLGLGVLTTLRSLGLIEMMEPATQPAPDGCVRVRLTPNGLRAMANACGARR